MKMPGWAIGVLSFSIIVVVLYLLNNDTVADLGEYRAELAVMQYIQFEEDVDREDITLTLEDTRVLEGELEHTKEVIYVFRFNDKDYKAVVRIDNVSGSMGYTPDWQFGEVLYVE